MAVTRRLVTRPLNVFSFPYNIDEALRANITPSYVEAYYYAAQFVKHSYTSFEHCPVLAARNESPNAFSSNHSPPRFRSESSLFEQRPWPLYTILISNTLPHEHLRNSKLIKCIRKECQLSRHDN